MARRRGTPRVRRYVALAATTVVLGPLIWLWQDSLLPASYSVMDLGYADHGGAAGAHTQHLAGSQAPARTVDPGRPADVSVTLEARRETVRLPSGESLDGYTLNGHTPGPTIRASPGQLVEVRLVNRSVPDGITLHWHGIEVPNAADGVAGVTQDAVRPGEEFSYRFVVTHAGTYWYHSHQLSHEQVLAGLLGALVVAPEPPAPDVVDVVALSHRYAGVATVNGQPDLLEVATRPGQRARVRVINTDNGPISAWVTGAYRLVAIDGRDLNRPALVENTAVLVTAGGRADLEITMPSDGAPVRVHTGAASVVLGSPPGTAPPIPRPKDTLDPLTYGEGATLPFDPNRPDRTFSYDIGRRPGFLDGRPGLWWTINGHLYPNVPAFVVGEGDIVRMRITNHSGEVHPMHLHGHHAVVLARDGVAATGSPWWFDTLNVADGESYDIAFRADNPGIWMDHCHNLVHAAEGFVAHLMYDGVTTPFAIGGVIGNHPE